MKEHLFIYLSIYLSIYHGKVHWCEVRLVVYSRRLIPRVQLLDLHDVQRCS